MITSKKHRRPVYAVLLAAGESRRCRPKKLLLPWGEKKVLEKSVANLTGSRAEETVVVLGHDPEPLQKILARLPCLVTRNRDYRRGMASSFLTGIIEIRKAFSPPADAGFLLALADAPFIDPKIVNMLVDAYRTKKADIVVPVCNGRRGHPSIFHGRFSDEVAAGDPGGRGEKDFREISRPGPSCRNKI